MKTTIRWTAGLALMALGGGCELIAGLGNPQLDEGAGGKGGTGGATALCTDGVKNGGETAKDCGGPCDPCPVGGGCVVGPDCASEVCIGGTCAAPACDDKVKNGDELDVDCGGSCGKCGAGKACGGDQDCKGGTCSGGVCASTCVDAEKGGSETDVDCGGGVASGCAGCAIGKGCEVGGDCVTGVCVATTCIDDHVWSEKFDAITAQGLVVDVFGNSTLVGNFSGAVDMGKGLLTSAGSTDLVVAHFDAGGTPIWTSRFGDAKSQGLNDVAVDASGALTLAGSFDGTLDWGGFPSIVYTAGGNDVFVAKLSTLGKPGWVASFGDDKEQYGSGVAVDDSGATFLTGKFDGSVEFGGGPLFSKTGNDMFVVKLGIFGKEVWSHQFGAVAGPGPRIAVDASGNTVLAGAFGGTINFGGGDMKSAGGYDLFVAKFDAAGQYLWATRFGDMQPQLMKSLAVDGAGNVIIAGNFYGSCDFGGGLLTATGIPGNGADVFLVKLDPGGNHLWSKRFGDEAEQYAQSVAVDKSGNVTLIGSFFGEVDFGGEPFASADLSDIYVARFDASGNHLWSKRFGDNNSQQGGFVAAYDTQNVLISGYFNGVVDLGGTPLSSLSSASVFLAKLRLP